MVMHTDCEEPGPKIRRWRCLRATSDILVILSGLFPPITADLPF